MALRINTNVQSLMAQRQLGIQNTSLNKSLERLSSGLRINRAADDAAGLAISETLRAQVRGMHQAVANSQDSINLIQTAEGGLNETTNILQRMRELAIQAANDTYTQGDREKIQVELDQLKEELTRIANTTQFNGRTLLNGEIAQAKSLRNAEVDIKANQRVGGLTGAGVPNFDDLIADVAFNGIGATTADVDAAIEVKVVATQTVGTYNIELRASDGTTTTLTDVTGNSGGTNLFGTGTAVSFGLTSGVTVDLTFGNVSVQAADVGDVATVQVQSRQAAVTTDQALTFHIGQNEGQIVKFGVSAMDAAALKLEGVGVLGTDDASSRTRAQNLIGILDEALRKVNVERSKMGAMQNRLEHSIANLNVASENLSASESRIRDTDVAKESARLTRAQILVQAGTAMLAQANSTPQNALSLLRG